MKHGPNPDNAAKLISYLLFDPGQTLLFSPEIARLPVVPALDAKAPKGYPNPFQLKLGGVIYIYMQSAVGRGAGAALGVVAILLVAVGTAVINRLSTRGTGAAFRL